MFWKSCLSSRLCVPEISVQGEKYLDEQIENAITGVKEMKSVMEKSGEDHKKLLTVLEKTKQQKEVLWEDELFELAAAQCLS